MRFLKEVEKLMSKVSFKFLAIVTLMVSLVVITLRTAVAHQQEGDADVLAKMQQINESLRGMGLNLAVEEIHFYTIGQGRPSNRIHQAGLRWVAGDLRRLADGENITYLVDQSDGATASGLTNAQTEAALDSALSTWDAHRCLRKVDIRRLFRIRGFRKPFPGRYR
jgi:hypothetical protein